MDQNTEIDNLWINIIKGYYPNTYTRKQLIETKMDYAVHWMFQADSEKAKIYDKFYVMKKLKGL